MKHWFWRAVASAAVGAISSGVLLIVLAKIDHGPTSLSLSEYSLLMLAASGVCIAPCAVSGAVFYWFGRGSRHFFLAAIPAVVGGAGLFALGIWVYFTFFGPAVAEVSVPMSLGFVAFTVPGFVTVATLKAITIWIDRPPQPGHCRCGYDLTGNVSGICPECGDRI